MAELVPIRYGRMLASPFAYFCGAAAVMASDLAHTPTIGVDVQACGDAHIANFGVYPTPERHIVFDVHDFDETLPAPWEYDIKRLATSLVLDVRDAGWSDERARHAVHVAIERSRAVLNHLSSVSTLETQYAQMDEARFFCEYTDPAGVKYARHVLDRANRRANAQAAKKWVHDVDGCPRFVDDPPLLIRLSDEAVDQFHELFNSYRSTLQDNRRHVLEHFRFTDVAHKVVGVGSVGMRSYVILLEGRGEHDDLILQAKQATSSALSPIVGPSGFRNHGQRVVVGQRLMQSASDPFLGWAPLGARDFYVRQLRDHKGSADRSKEWKVYLGEARIIGGTQARSHARSVDPALLRGYVGRSDRLARAMVGFGLAYAAQTEADYDALQFAAARGEVPVEHGV